MIRPATLFVGLGSPHGDDQVGWLVAEKLQAASVGSFEIRRAADPAAILNWLQGIAEVQICDACRTCAEPGTIHRWRWPHTEEFRTAHGPGTHGLSLHAALRLAENLQFLPARVTIWGIEIESCDTLAPLSAAVEAAADRLAKTILRQCGSGLISTFDSH